MRFVCYTILCITLCITNGDFRLFRVTQRTSVTHGRKRKTSDNSLIITRLSWAENGTRTRDLNLGKVALYQLSYFRITLQTFRFVNLSLFIREVLFTPPRMFVNLATSRSRCLYRIASAKICQKNYSPKLLWFFLRFYFKIFISFIPCQAVS